MPTATYTLEEPTNKRRFSVRGTGPDEATAQAEADAKLAMTVGTLISGRISSDMAVLGAPATGVYSDVNIVLYSPGSEKTVTLRMQNVTNAIAVGNSGLVDITDPLVAAVASAYEDADGNIDWIVISGEFVP